jgi:hypothetical protein
VNITSQRTTACEITKILSAVLTATGVAPQEFETPVMKEYTVEPWIASIIRSRSVLVIQNTRISKRGRREGKTGSIVNT